MRASVPGVCFAPVVVVTFFLVCERGSGFLDRVEPATCEHPCPHAFGITAGNQVRSSPVCTLKCRNYPHHLRNPLEGIIVTFIRTCDPSRITLLFWRCACVDPGPDTRIACWPDPSVIHRATTPHEPTPNDTLHPITSLPYPIPTLKTNRTLTSPMTFLFNKLFNSLFKGNRLI